MFKNRFCLICYDFVRFLRRAKRVELDYSPLGDSNFRIASDSIFILSGLSARNLSNLFKI